MSLLEVEDVSVRYPQRSRRAAPFVAVDSVSFRVEEGETLALVGESGSGKSSIGRAIIGLTPVSGGSIRFAGARLPPANGAGRSERRDIQAVFQDPYGSLSPALTVGQSLAEPLFARGGISRAAAADRIADLLERVGLPADTASRYPRAFSGGQRQRVAIARALALEPRLIVCDEPVSALDLSTQKLVLDLLIDLQRQTGVSYLFITHDLAVVRYVSHRVAVLQNGRILESGSTETVTESPAHPYTRQLLLSSPLPDVDAQAARRRARHGLAGVMPPSTLPSASAPTDQEKPA